MMEEKLRAGVTLVVDRYGYSGRVYFGEEITRFRPTVVQTQRNWLGETRLFDVHGNQRRCGEKARWIRRGKIRNDRDAKNVREVFADLREDWWNVVDADRTIEEVQKDVQTIAKDAVERCKRGKELEHFEPGW